MSPGLGPFFLSYIDWTTAAGRSWSREREAWCGQIDGRTAGERSRGRSGQSKVYGVMSFSMYVNSDLPGTFPQPTVFQFGFILKSFQIRKENVYESLQRNVRCQGPANILQCPIPDVRFSGMVLCTISPTELECNTPAAGVSVRMLAALALLV